LQDLGRYEESRRVFEQLLADCPDHTEAMNNLANVLTELERHEEARLRFERVLALKPEHHLSRWNLGLNQLRTGDWTNGWENYESRGRSHGPTKRSGRPLWKGEPLNGARITLVAEQGMGDLLQMSRFVRLVAERGGTVSVECHAPLKTLFARLPGVEHVIEVGGELPDHDFWLPMMSLPRVFGVTLEMLPGPIPYLTPEPTRVAYWRERLDAWRGIRTGFVWSGNPKFLVNAKRSLSPRDVRQLSRVTKQSTGAPVHLFSLQKGVPVPTGAGLIPLDDDSSSMDDLAAVMMNLDLIVSVDTSVAHLAGALGRPVWTMLAAHADWRWMTGDRTTSPWYPSMRLLRQKRPGDWSNVIETVADGLSTLKERRSAAV
jgi:Tetratricopeptide repeat/Glycosyltransferase family 9 (heptosyltransferase)